MISFICGIKKKTQTPRNRGLVVARGEERKVGGKGDGISRYKLPVTK